MSDTVTASLLVDVLAHQGWRKVRSLEWSQRARFLRPRRHPIRDPSHGGR